jgi:hypothetical protein
VSSSAGGTSRRDDAAATPSGEVAWCVQVIDAVLRWDHQVSIGEQEGPMPATLGVSLNHVREILYRICQTIVEAINSGSV